MLSPNLELLYEAIRESRFQDLLTTYNFGLRYARYDFSGKDYEVNMIIFESEDRRCRLLFVYPGGTVDVYIGPISAYFDSNEWLRVDYLASYFLQQSIITWHSSKFYTPETIMKDILARLYEIFAPFVDRSVQLVYKDVNGEWREKVKGYVLERLKQK